MKKINIQNYLNSKRIFSLIEEIPTEISFFVDDNTDRSYNFFKRNIPNIVIAEKKVNETIILHELLHIKAKFAGYYSINFAKKISSNIKTRIANIHSTYEHINFVYPAMLKFGINPYNEEQTALLIKEFKAKSISDMTLSNFFCELIPCCYFETEKKENKRFIITLIKKFPNNFAESLAFFVVKLKESLVCTSINSKNQKLKEMVTFIGKTFNISDCIKFYAF